MEIFGAPLAYGEGWGLVNLSLLRLLGDLLIEKAAMEGHIKLSHRDHTHF
jgi:hypothetical protein